MTIRRRLTLSFLAVLVLFGLNLTIYFWGGQKRSASVEDLHRAMARQNLLGSISQELNDLRKQVTLLSEIMAEAATGGASSEDIAKLSAQLGIVDQQIRELEELSDPVSRQKASSFHRAFRELSASWKVFYENFGVRQTKAVIELAARGDPLSQDVIGSRLPELERSENLRMDEARARFYDVARITNRITIAIFVLSALVAFTVAYLLSRYLTRALGRLQAGALFIGMGQFDHRIPADAPDELGSLAGAYNEMAEHLHQSRKELTYTNLELERRNEELEKQRRVAESLLLNILPAQVAEELQTKGAVDPKYFEDVTLLFTDFAGFTLSTEKMAAEDLVYLLHDYFTSFDRIVARYRLEKLKTIGDSYMCVSGLPARTPSHPVDAVLAAIEMVRAVTERDQTKLPAQWTIRLGIHTGPVAAGVVGIHKFAFDVWGETVNFSSRMESCGAPNRINISERTYTRVKDFFECEYRGKVPTKEKREVDMYFVNGVLPSLMDDPTQNPPPAFLRRYRVYFQKDPPAFPAFLLESSPTPGPVLDE